MNIKDFLIDNYIYIIIVIVLTIITIIGFLADKKKTGNKIVNNSNPAPVPPAPMNNQPVAPMTYQPPQDVQVNNNMAMPGMMPAPEPVMNNNVNPLPNMTNGGSTPIPEAVLNNSIKSEPTMNNNMTLPGMVPPVAPEPVPDMMNQNMMPNNGPVNPVPAPLPTEPTMNNNMVMPGVMPAPEPTPMMTPEAPVGAPMPTFGGNMGMAPEPQMTPVNNMPNMQNSGIPSPIPNPNMGMTSPMPEPMPQAPNMGSMPQPMPAQPTMPSQGMTNMPNNNIQSPVSFVYGGGNNNNQM